MINYNTPLPLVITSGSTSLHCEMYDASKARAAGKVTFEVKLKAGKKLEDAGKATYSIASGRLRFDIAAHDHVNETIRVRLRDLLRKEFDT